MKKLIVFLFFFSILSNAQTALPEVTLTNLEGKSIELKKEFAEKDKLYIFSFWATWCGPCINELDELNDVVEDWKKELNLQVIAISTDDARTQKRVKPLVNGKGWGYTILLDTNQDLKRALTIVNIPYTIVVKNGQIVHIQNGYVPGSENELLAKLKQL
ncbi:MULTISPECIES: TlpA family protein disulfide reductase [Flavobacterium]|jgi:thiol-disulfide isomerase/thioredoxin|uniref:TlpA family protein disulfide reductase n=1 Tax=Flavobacterium stagni TaxID=2506421 RepID=A0A4Q1KC97_9FLAO|nr:MULTISPECIES: TlpA disulfide reductase family protein [Flavobacterium]RXR24129.1 TlpA family protein disulfide reductase [Flavobacterium stagni]